MKSPGVLTVEVEVAGPAWCCAGDDAEPKQHRARSEFDRRMDRRPFDVLEHSTVPKIDAGVLEETTEERGVDRYRRPQDAVGYSLGRWVHTPELPKPGDDLCAVHPCEVVVLD